MGVIKGQLIVNLALVFDLIMNRVVKFQAKSERSKARHIILNASPWPEDMIQLIQRDQAWLTALDEVLSGVVDSFHADPELDRLFTPLDRAKLLPPILSPGKIVCVGHNYAAHARERKAEPHAEPVFFLKSNNTLCGPGDPILPPPNSSQVDFEAELAVVIGKQGREVPEDRVYEFIAGYTILNDVTARDMQSRDVQWFRGKSCDTFAPTGPCLVTRDEIPDPHNLKMSLTVNGQTMQNANSGEMIFKIPYMISYLSQSLTWEPGDILSTGTPAGIGAGRTPPVFLKPEDTVSATIERIGTLTNPVKARTDS